MNNPASDVSSILRADLLALEYLDEASSRLWSLQNIHEGVDEMLGASILLMGADFGNVQLLEAKKSTLRIVCQRGFDEDFLETFREVSCEDTSACGQALASGNVTTIEDTDTDPLFSPFREIARRSGFRSVISVPLLLPNGEILGVISTHFRSPRTFEDKEIHRFKRYARRAAEFIHRCQTEQVLEEERSRLLMAASISNLGWCSWNLTQETMTWSERCKVHFDLAMDQEPSLEHFYSVVHPDDLNDIRKAIQHAIQAHSDFEADFRVLTQKGSTRWLSTKSRVWIDKTGDTLMSGVTRDITDVKLLDRARRLSDERLQLAMDASEDGIWDWNMVTGDCYFSSSYFKMLGYEPNELPHRLDTFFGFLLPEDQAKPDLCIEQLETFGKCEVDFRLRHRNGEVRWISSHGKVVERDSEGKPIRSVGIHRDITKQKQDHLLLEELNRNLEKRIKERTHQADEANKAKSRFSWARRCV